MYLQYLGAKSCITDDRKMVLVLCSLCKFEARIQNEFGLGANSCAIFKRIIPRISFKYTFCARSYKNGL